MLTGALTSLVDAATNLLRDTKLVVDSVDADRYASSCNAADGATIGQHVRHLAAHFEALMVGFEKDSPVAYDRRVRGGAVETDRAVALEHLDALIAQLVGLDDVQLNMPVRVRVLPAAGMPEVELESNLGRELAFVTHHGVHHHALIKFIAGQHGVELDSALGRAPSTREADAGAAG